MTHCSLSTLHLLTLLSVKNIGNKTVNNILNFLTFSPSNLQELHEVLRQFTNAGLGLGVPTEHELEESLRHAEKILEEHERAQIKVVGWGDPEFPPQLQEIPDPPLVLYVKGDVNCLNPERSVAVVGTREPTDYGRERANKIAQIFVKRNLIVVSGLAVGCDTAGHEGCLKANGRTVAVLAHGLHMVYPAQNRRLAQQIVDSGGCLVSEYPIGVKPFKTSFVKRDRLQSGLSSAVVIIETDIKGGTMHTARFCLEQKKILACINHPPDRRTFKSQGNQKLISEKKAIPLKTPEELDDFLIRAFGESVVSHVSPEPVITEPASLETEPITKESSPLEKVVSETITAEAAPASLEPSTPETTISDFVAAETTLLQIEQTIPETILIENEYVTLELSLKKDKQQRFETQCNQEGKTRNQVLEELIDLYLISPPTILEARADNPNLKQKQSTNNDPLLPGLEKLFFPQDIQNDLSDKSAVKAQETSPDRGLKRKQLAERLQVKPDDISKHKKKGDESFKAWTSKQDPQKIAWVYSKETGLYEPDF